MLSQYNARILKMVADDMGQFGMVYLPCEKVHVEENIFPSIDKAKAFGSQQNFSNFGRRCAQNHNCKYIKKNKYPVKLKENKSFPNMS